MQPINYISLTILLVAALLYFGLNYEKIFKGKKEEAMPSYERILSIFKDINKVPRPSKHEEKMTLYLENFAKSHNLKYIIDGKNVLIYKNATSGMEKAPMVTLQAHQDMVCVAKDGYKIDFLNQGIETINDGIYIRSKDNNSSIGADDGIGVSIILAVLESKTIKHGPLECLFTWDEEQGFSGALQLTPGILKGKYMMNIDWEDDGELCIGSAGGIKVSATLAYKTTATPKDYAAYQLSVSGLSGGHSGVNIVNGGANAIKLLGDFLAKQTDLLLGVISGGSFSNVICNSATATVTLPSVQKEKFEKEWNTYVAEIKKKYATSDPDMVCEIKSVATPSKSMTNAHTRATFNGLAKAVQGVTEWSKTVDNMFEVSNNVGLITMEKGVLNIEYLVRGFENKKIDELANKLIAGFEESKVGFTCRKHDAFSPWNPNVNSKLMNYSRLIYQKHFGKPIILKKTGGGLELSEFTVAYPDMEFISFGPTILDAHSINEAIEIKTVKSCWEYTVELLENISDLK